MRLYSFITGLSVFVLSVLMQQAVAGERLEYSVIQANTRERITLYIQGSQARILSSANKATAVIYHAGNQQIHILNHSDKSITTVDQASLERLASIAKGMGEIAKSQGGVLGDIFKTFGLDNELGDSARIELKTLSGERKYSGQACEFQQVYHDGKLSTQICLAKNLRLQTEEKQTLDSLIKFAQLMLRQGQILMAQFNLPIPLLPDDALQGMPVFVDDIPSETTATLVGFKQMDVAAGQFALPEGYSRTVLSL